MRPDPPTAGPTLSWSDADLVQRYQAGNETAWDALYARYDPWLCRASRRYRVAGADQHDIQQWMRLALWQAVQSYDASRGLPVQGWVAVVVRRAMANVIRRSRRYSQLVFDTAISLETVSNSEEDNPITVADRIAAPGPDPEAIVIQRDTLVTVLTALAERLTPTEWRVLIPLMRHEPVRITARTRGLTCKQVDNTRQRIRRKARQWLYDETRG
ncbi:sigma-70 family RNA polymerase sigma factor [Sulfobacillus sp. hq2]|uniref:sigma-70 family RNA polymerase sigma factor n=1 Tax=Sulfobacillus TaxID=28033 RepID=UPI000CD25829|nr:sigma-70 family RNA polymerase sigma factor [Sulfobacillus sp. hq2]POB12316.1 hypothetical protein CO251_00165 [Sulfobacillus sp. hq2]